MNDTTNTEKKKPGRPPQTKPIEGSRISYPDRNALKVTGRDNDKYVYRIANSDDGRYSDRVENLKAMGYSVCNNSESLGDSKGTEASSIGSVIGKPVGNGTRGVLMRQLKTNYKEDQRLKQAEVDQTEMGMVDEDLQNANDTYGEGLKVDRKKPTFKVQQ
jgi:hypothetical protein